MRLILPSEKGYCDGIEETFNTAIVNKRVVIVKELQETLHTLYTIQQTTPSIHIR